MEKQIQKVATVLTVYGIETTVTGTYNFSSPNCLVATVLTVYGIETMEISALTHIGDELQQYLPFTVLKLKKHSSSSLSVLSCNSTYRLRY